MLSFVPVLNVFALGYQYRYFEQIHRGGGFAWPDWNDWEGLFFDGLRLLAIMALYGFLPVLIGFWVVSLLGWVSYEILGHPLYMALVSPLELLAPVWTVAMLYAYQPRRRWAVLRRPALAWLMTRAIWPALVVPALAFWGIMWLGFMLFGFAFFLGFTVLGAYYTRLFLEIESRGQVRGLHP
ncbi:MAG TPA: DUF4013 domain-containing protein [Opitutales bacterium]|nr:DUF4013 domain-containing protein [Opitutales bacterium]